MRGNGVRAWSPVLGALAIGLCLFGLSIKGAPAGDEVPSSEPRASKALGNRSNTTTRSSALTSSVPTPASASQSLPDTGATLSRATYQAPPGSGFGDEDGIRIISAVSSAASRPAAKRDGGAALPGEFCNCDSDCASPNTGDAGMDQCQNVVCSADSSGGNELDVGEQYTCQLQFLANGARCDLDGLFCTADECNGIGSCVADPDIATNPNPCLKRCTGSSNNNETCDKDGDCQGGTCASVSVCVEGATFADGVCQAVGGDVGRCCVYDPGTGNVIDALSGYKTPAACFASNTPNGQDTNWRRVQDETLIFRCPKYSAGIASTFDGAGALVEPVIGTEVGAVRRTDKVCEFDLTPCEDKFLSCLSVCLLPSGQIPGIQPISCTGDAECVAIDANATCAPQACAPLVCGQDSSHTLCDPGPPAEQMRCPGVFRIGDDYSVSNGSAIAVNTFSVRAGVDHAGGVLVYDFWDNTGPAVCTSDGTACPFIGESCGGGTGLCWGPMRVNSFGAAHATAGTDTVRTFSLDCGDNGAQGDCFGDTDAPTDPPFRIPGTGYVTVRSSRAFAGKANGFWRTADSVEVGTNDATRSWKDGGPIVEGVDELIAGANNEILAFEIVGNKIPDPIGACCGENRLACNDVNGLVSDCVGLLAGDFCGTGDPAVCAVTNVACDDAHRYECRTCKGAGGNRDGQMCSATRECSAIGASESICSSTSWKGARFTSTVPSLCASDVCNIGGCCDNGSCVNKTEALCVGANETFLGGGTTCFAAVTRQQGGQVAAFNDPDHNCCPQTHTYGDCCSDTFYCSGDATDNASCSIANPGANCGSLACEFYPFDFVCSEAGADNDCGPGAVAGSPCGTAGTCGIPCAGGAAGGSCSTTPYCLGVLGNPPCALVCDDGLGDCTGAGLGSPCGTTGEVCIAPLAGTPCFQGAGGAGGGTCTLPVCIQPACEFCAGPVEQFIDVLNSPTTVCENSGAVCDPTKSNGGICDCPQNAAGCSFVCAGGANNGLPCTLTSELADCGAGIGCGIDISGNPAEGCVTGLPFLTLTLSGTRPFKDDPQSTGLSKVFDFEDGDDCSLDANDPGIYEVFEITDFSRVTIDTCCKTPNFSRPYITLFEACNCNGFDFILSNIGQGGGGNTGLFQQGDNKADLRCEADTNLSMTFDLPAGKYAYPINSNRFCSTAANACDDILDCPSGETCSGQNERDYQVHITAVRAQVAACCGGSNCTLTTRLECEGNDQLPTNSPFFPGGPFDATVGGQWLGSQGPLDAIVGSPQFACGVGAANVCILGSCCGATGSAVASCIDFPTGGAAGDGISETDCVAIAPNGSYQGGVRCTDNPCPACPLKLKTDCQQSFNSNSASSDRNDEARTADDFIPVASSIDRLCWSGVWGGFEGGIRCNNDPPDSTWYLTIYEDNGNGIPGNIVIGPEVPFMHDGRKIIDLQNAFKPTRYSGDISGLVTGLIPGNCYWIEIMGEGSGDLNGDESCGWNWMRTDTSGGGQGEQAPSQDGNGWSAHVFAGHPIAYTESNLQKYDLAWCADTGIIKNSAGNEGVDGGCGVKRGTFACCFRDPTGAPQCTSQVSLFECILSSADNGLNGSAFAGEVCVDAGGTFVCQPPANDDCDTGAQVIPTASCVTASVGNCSKDNSVWCSPLAQACGPGLGGCQPIVDANAQNSSEQFDCGVTITDNRFATTDGPSGMNNSNVIDDCSGSSQGGDPFHADVWYKVTAPCSGVMKITMCGGAVYDAMLAAYTQCPAGNDNNAPDLIECNDDACGSFETVSDLPNLPVANGQEVTIRVGGWSPNAIRGSAGEAGQGLSQISVRYACFTASVEPVGTLAGEAGFSKDRYVSIDATTNSTEAIAIRVTRVGSTVSRYVDCAAIVNKSADGNYARLIDGPLPLPTDPGASSFYCDQSATTSGLHIRGCNVVPGNDYEIDVTKDGVEFSTITVITTTSPQVPTREFGDVLGVFDGAGWTAPDGVVTTNDIVGVIKKFVSEPGAPIIARVDNTGAVPNTLVVSDDVLRSVVGFAGGAFGSGVTGCLAGMCVPSCD